MGKSIFQQRLESEAGKAQVRLDVDSTEVKAIVRRLPPPAEPADGGELVERFVGGLSEEQLDGLARNAEATFTEGEKALIAARARKAAPRPTSLSAFDELKELVERSVSSHARESLNHLVVGELGELLLCRSEAEESVLPDHFVHLAHVFEWMLSSAQSQRSFGWGRLEALIRRQFPFPALEAQDHTLTAADLVELAEGFCLLDALPSVVRHTVQVGVLESVLVFMNFYFGFYYELDAASVVGDSELYSQVKKAVFGEGCEESADLWGLECWDAVAVASQRIAYQLPAASSGQKNLLQQLIVLREKRNTQRFEASGDLRVMGLASRSGDLLSAWKSFRQALRCQEKTKTCSHPLLWMLCTRTCLPSALNYYIKLKASYAVERIVSLQPEDSTSPSTRLLAMFDQEFLARVPSRPETTVMLSVTSHPPLAQFSPEMGSLNPEQEEQRKSLVDGHLSHEVLVVEVLRCLRFFANHPASECPTLYFEFLLRKTWEFPAARADLAVAVTRSSGFFALLKERFLFDSFCHPLFCSALVVLFHPRGEPSAIAELIEEIFLAYTDAFTHDETIGRLERHHSDVKAWPSALLRRLSAKLEGKSCLLEQIVHSIFQPPD